MAKRRRGGFRRATRTVYRAARKAYRRGKKSGSLTRTLLGGFAYGAVRNPVANAIQPVTNMVPGGMGDELGMAVVSYFAAKQGGLIGDIGRAGLVVEAASAGNQLVGGKLGGNTGGAGGWV